MPAPAPALLALLALTCARAEIFGNHGAVHIARQRTDTTDTSSVGGCMYAGRWYAEGVAVRVRDACLQCACAHGALSCARAACAAAPHPPPRRCALLHRRDACCPELHCPDGVRSLELTGSARLEEESWDVATPAAPGHACAEEGGVFAAGSALAARAACEQCFCLRGARTCVRPRCLPPPAGCSARPAPGACCPQRYYCTPMHGNYTVTSAPTTPAHGKHDCLVDGEWVSEGERMKVPGADNCTQCFCLRGAARCQPLECAPALRGCAPLLGAGQCCPHQYQCPHRDRVSSIPVISSNYLLPSGYDKRSFRSPSSTKSVDLVSSPASLHASPAPLATTKVKRKTSDPPPSTASHKTTSSLSINTSNTSMDNGNSSTPSGTTKSSETTKLTETTKSSGTTMYSGTTKPATEATSQTAKPTDQPEDSARVIINGTINCTAELSSTLVNVTTFNETEKSSTESQSRVSAAAETVEDKQAPEVITEDPDGGDSFTVSVSSSLRHSNSSPAAAAPPPPQITQPSNKTTKDDYDYDYTEPTLPPSLPNLKIIPFVAADAVVDDDVPSKDEMTFPALEREDKFPVYYANVGERQKETPFATRREDVVEATYPVFSEERPAAPAPAPTVAPSVPSHIPLQPHAPELSRFSPPVETEGGFVPKGPGIIDEYYAVYPRTPPPVPHLTTSMPINPAQPDLDDCITGTGERVSAGAAVRLQCALCVCAKSRLICSPPDCPDNATSTPISPSTLVSETALNTTEQMELIPFDPPADRSPPETSLVDPLPLPPLSPSPMPSSLPSTSAFPLKTSSSTSTPVTNPPSPVPPVASTTSKTTSNTLRPDSAHTTPPFFSTESTKITTSHPMRTEAPVLNATSDTENQSQEYEDEDEDEGFSFGSVLKLLLSETYDSTTASTLKNKSTPSTVRTTSPSTTHLPTTTTRVTRPPVTTAAPFIPLPHHPYIPPRKGLPHNTVNRIDHLVLGEATAIKKTTFKPVLGESTVIKKTTSTFKPTSSVAPPKRYMVGGTSQRPPSSRGPEPVAAPAPPLPGSAGQSLGAGLLKLAGCNIYGRMYRVGRIIAELSTPCQECRCTELGVQCAPLRC